MNKTENEPAHDKTPNKTCVNSKDTDQLAHPPSMARVLVYPSLDTPEAVEENTCAISEDFDQTARMRRLI